MSIIKLENLESKIINHKNTLSYGVETRDINKVVKHNPDKFPNGYIVELSKKEKNELLEKFHHFNNLKHSTVNPKCFTEKGLYLVNIMKNKIVKQRIIEKNK